MTFSKESELNRIAVITGAASGIGLGVSKRLISEGWTVWALDISEASLQQAAGQLNAGDQYRTATCDVASTASTIQAFARISASTKSIEALICCAGAIRIGWMEEYTPEEVDLMLGVNIKGPWLCVRTALPLLREGANVDKPKRVVIVGSVSGLRPKVGSGMYAATKAAVHVLTGIMAVELAPSGITVNAIAPGTTDTPMIVQMGQTTSKVPFKLSGKSPLGRMAQPDDMADAVSYLLSDGARYINGVVLPVDGGTRAAHV